jgi:hypothetical protein
MLNWIHELETFQPELEKDKVISLSDHRIRTLQRLCRLPLYQVAMVALYCTMRKSGKTLRSLEFLEAARKALPGKPVVRGFEALITSNWMRVYSDGAFSNDEIVRLTRQVDQALQNSDFSLLPPAKEDDPHWHLRRLYARASQLRRGHRTARDWSFYCDDFVRHMSVEQRNLLNEAAWPLGDRDLVFYAATIMLMEGGELDIRALLQLFGVDPVQRAILRSELVHPDHPLLRDLWWSMEESYRGDRMIKLSDRLMKLFVPELKLEHTQKVHSALNTISSDSIETVELIYDAALQKQLHTITQLCRPRVFESYVQSYAQNAMRGLVVQLHGAPGTGKTEFCYQLARQTGRDVLVLDVSQARDKYYGETEKIITGIFNEYRKQVQQSDAFPILLFNEGDSIFQKRVSNDRESSQTENIVQTILLNELERFQGILMVTTNTPHHFDKAFERRFQFRLQFSAPGEQVRLQLLRNALPEGKLSVLQRIAYECQFTAAELQNALRKIHIEKLCGNVGADRIAAIWEMLRNEKPAKQRIGFRV